MSTEELIQKIKSHLNKEGIKFLLENDLLKSYTREIIMADMIKNLSLNNDDKKKGLKAFMDINNLKNKEQLEEFRTRKGLGIKALEWKILKPIKIQNLASNLFSIHANSRFEKRKDSLDLVVYSMLRTKEKELALELYLRIESNEFEFSTIAHEYSQGEEKITKGIIGPIPFSQGNPFLMNKLKSLRQGELMEPFALDGWWIVLRLENLISAKFSESVKLQMCIEMFEEFLNSESEKNMNLMIKDLSGAT
tara:strand:- start:2735 stop:3484 length:750 start_codon:yes stop_codon:yes gene_type:complete